MKEIGQDVGPASETDTVQDALGRMKLLKILYIVGITLLTLAISSWSITFNSSGITVSEVYGSIINYVFSGTIDIPEKTQ